MANCPCGKTQSYAKCCGLIHQNIQLAKTAEQLMRSRYSAFTKAMGDYLMISHHSFTRPMSEKNEIVKWSKSVEWDKLEIIQSKKGSVLDTEGTVEFKAYFFTTNFGIKKRDCIHEKSKFVKENGHWVYLEGLNLN